MGQVCSTKKPSRKGRLLIQEADTFCPKPLVQTEVFRTQRKLLRYSEPSVTFHNHVTQGRHIERGREKERERGGEREKEGDIERDRERGGESEGLLMVDGGNGSRRRQ